MNSLGHVHSYAKLPEAISKDLEVKETKGILKIYGTCAHFLCAFNQHYYCKYIWWWSKLLFVARLNGGCLNYVRNTCYPCSLPFLSILLFWTPSSPFTSNWFPTCCFDYLGFTEGVSQEKKSPRLGPSRFPKWEIDQCKDLTILVSKSMLLICYLHCYRCQ